MILGIYGSGGSGREVKEIAEQLNVWEELVFIDDTVPEDIFKGIKRLPFDMFSKLYKPEETKIVIALGEPKYKRLIREKVENAGYGLANVIHPTAVINPSATIGKGVIVQVGAMISSDAVVEDNVTLQAYSIVGHDTIIQKDTQVSSHVIIAGHCEVGSSTYIGLCVPIKDRVKVGSNTIIGMGSVVQRDIPDGVVALGNPARPMKKNEEFLVFK